MQKLLKDQKQLIKLFYGQTLHHPPTKFLFENGRKSSYKIRVDIQIASVLEIFPRDSFASQKVTVLDSPENLLQLSSAFFYKIPLFILQISPFGCE